MSGIYKISSITPAQNKYECRVSFNGKPEELYEVEVPNDVGSDPSLDEDGNEVKEGGVGVLVKRPLPELTPAFVAETLQKVADDDFDRMNAPTLEEVEIGKNGQIVL